MIGGQILIMFVGGRAFSVTRLNPAQWAYSLVLGAISIPIGVIIRLIPVKSPRNPWTLRLTIPTVFSLRLNTGQH